MIWNYSSCIRVNVMMKRLKKSICVPERYSANTLDILHNAKKKLKEKERKGYCREQAFEDLFNVQERIATRINDHAEISLNGKEHETDE